VGKNGSPFSHQNWHGTNQSEDLTTKQLCFDHQNKGVITRQTANVTIQSSTLMAMEYWKLDVSEKVTKY
jgi:hypothetical protein